MLAGGTTNKLKFLLHNSERLTLQIIHLNKNGVACNWLYSFNMPSPIVILISKMYLSIGVVFIEKDVEYTVITIRQPNGG